MPTSTLSDTELQIIPKGPFSRHFDLYRGGQFFLTLHRSFWTEACEFTIAGHEFAIRRASLWKDAFQLFAGDQSVCEVKRPFWSRSFALSADLDGAREKWLLQPAGWFTRDYQMLAADSKVGQREVGTIRPTGLFTRHRVADFTDEVPLPVQVFAIFLVIVAAQRQQKRSSSVGGV